jgi:hypothetical protein
MVPFPQTCPYNSAGKSFTRRSTRGQRFRRIDLEQCAPVRSNALLDSIRSTLATALRICVMLVDPVPALKIGGPRFEWIRIPLWFLSQHLKCDERPDNWNHPHKHQLGYQTDRIFSLRHDAH